MSPEPIDPGGSDGALAGDEAGRGDGVAGLEPFRRRLDFLDGEIARLLGERFEVCRKVAHYKREHDIPMMQHERVVEVRERYLARGGEVDLPDEFTSDLFDLVIEATCAMEDELMADPAPVHQPGLEPGSPDFKSGPFTA